MTVDKYHIGGIRYNPGTAAEVHEQNRILQENSKIPLIIACNTENGGNGACSNGTMIGAQTKIGATGDAKYAKALGKMANTEAAAIGCNLSFAPVSDIYYNWHNPVVGLRTYGNDPQRVMEMTQAYMEGAHEVPGFCCAAKHFPGDGLDDRDQHVANSVNTFFLRGIGRHLRQNLRKPHRQRAGGHHGRTYHASKLYPCHEPGHQGRRHHAGHAV